MPQPQLLIDYGVPSVDTARITRAGAGSLGALGMFLASAPRQPSNVFASRRQQISNRIFESADWAQLRLIIFLWSENSPSVLARIVGSRTEEVV